MFSCKFVTGVYGCMERLTFKITKKIVVTLKFIIRNKKKYYKSLATWPRGAACGFQYTTYCI